MDNSDVWMFICILAFQILTVEREILYVKFTTVPELYISLLIY